MRALLLALALLLTASAAWAGSAIDALPFKNVAQEQRFQHLTGQLRCLVCQNESLADSNADLAKDLRWQVFQQMQAGKTDAQIKQYLVARYSDYVLYDPPLKPSNYVLWFGPFAVLLAGAAGAALYLRRRSRADAAPADSGDEDW